MNKRICFRCYENHPESWDCVYNLTYQYWLLRELEKVDRVLKSKENAQD